MEITRCWLTRSASGFVRVDDEQRYAHVSPLRLEVTVAGADVTDLKVELAEGLTLNGVVSVEGGTQLPDRLKIELISPVLSSSNADEESQYSEAPAVGDAFIMEKGVFSISQLHTRIVSLSSLQSGNWSLRKVDHAQRKRFTSQPRQTREGQEPARRPHCPILRARFRFGQGGRERRQE